MSLINQMLKDIDKRQGAAPSVFTMPHEVRGVSQGRDGLRPSFFLIGGGLGAALLIVGATVYFWGYNPSPSPHKPEESVVQALPSIDPVAVAQLPAPATTLPSLPSLPSTPVSGSDLTQDPLDQAKKTSAAANAPEMAPKPALAKAEATSGSFSRVITPEQRAENLYRESMSFMRQEQLPHAQGLLKKALLAYPAHHDARQLLARMLTDAGQADEAKALLREGLSIAPQRNEFFMALAHAHLKSNDLNAAIQAMESGLASGVDNAEYHAFLATLLQRKGQHEEAIQHYVVALRKTPDTANWLVGLGISLQAQNNLVNAADAYQRAIDLGLSPSLMQFAQEKLRQLGR